MLAAIGAATSVHPHTCGEIQSRRCKIDAWEPVHPHTCGEINGALQNGHVPFGSPPHVWGNHKPAASNCRSMPVHPHACGENSVSCMASCPASGSPPHVWGNPDQRPYRAPSASGSPPHVWGNQRQRRPGRGRQRFTPTRVGKSLSSTRALPSVHRFTPTRVGKSPLLPPPYPPPAVHPHTCGEIDTFTGDGGTVLGSPPHVWGNRWAAWLIIDLDPVHPHACGEIAAICDSDSAMRGSPPRVWGNRARRHGDAVCIRFTPTRVGKSRTARCDIDP